jgi:tRNA pseudouridine55 synthase
VDAAEAVRSAQASACIAPPTSAQPSSSGGVPPEILDAIAGLTGDIMQVPAKVSAIKVDGQRSHARVRAGEDVELAARPVTVSRFDVQDARCDEVDGVPVLDLDVCVEVSSGTYVRALARDLAAALGTAGHLTALRRTRVGGHALDGAHTLEQLAASVEADGYLKTIELHEAAAAHLPLRRLTLDETRELGYGRWIDPTGEPDAHAAIAPDGALVAVLEDTRRRGVVQARPMLVFTKPS